MMSGMSVLLRHERSCRTSFDMELDLLEHMLVVSMEHVALVQFTSTE